MEFGFIENLRLVVFTLLCGQYVFCSDNIQINYVEKFSPCSLADFSHQNIAKSEIECASACLQEEANCVAYQWDEASGSCKMQDKLNMTVSSATKDDVGVLMGDPPVKYATDCADILATDPTSDSGVYLIMIAGQCLRPVWCDMDTDGGGWTVFLKRLDGSVDFYHDRGAYKEGFGDVSGEYWLGLDALHAMTASKTYKLRVDMSDWEGASVYSLYESMVVADESEDYILTLGSFLGGEGGNVLFNSQGMKFTTRDEDLDAHLHVNCAVHTKGAFWHDSACQLNLPTSLYYIGGAYPNVGWQNNGIEWRSWSAHNDFYSMKTLDMKLRP